MIHTRIDNNNFIFRNDPRYYDAEEIVEDENDMELPELSSESVIVSKAKGKRKINNK